MHQSIVPSSLPAPGPTCPRIGHTYAKVRKVKSSEDWKWYFEQWLNVCISRKMLAILSSAKAKTHMLNISPILVPMHWTPSVSLALALILSDRTLSIQGKVHFRLGSWWPSKSTIRSYTCNVCSELSPYLVSYLPEYGIWSKKCRQFITF